MAIQSFPTGENVAPDYPARGKHKSVKKETQFGEGYTQRGSLGLNSKRQVWTMVYNLTLVNGKIITDFLDEVGSVEAFLFTTPRGEILRFTVPDGYSDVYPTFDKVRITVKIRQEFDLPEV